MAIDSSVHGYNGEFSVSAGTNAQPAFQKDFFKACSNVGIDTTADVQNFRSANAVGVSSSRCSHGQNSFRVLIIIAEIQYVDRS